jgi:hypothetical protein
VEEGPVVLRNEEAALVNGEQEEVEQERRLYRPRCR